MTARIYKLDGSTIEIPADAITWGTKDGTVIHVLLSSKLVGVFTSANVIGVELVKAPAGE